MSDKDKNIWRIVILSVAIVAMIAGVVVNVFQYRAEEKNLKAIQEEEQLIHSQILGVVDSIKSLRQDFASVKWDNSSNERSEFFPTPTPIPSPTPTNSPRAVTSVKRREISPTPPAPAFTPKTVIRKYRTSSTEPPWWPFGHDEKNEKQNESGTQESRKKNLF